LEQTILFAFRGDPLCFVHVLLNSLDLNKKGMGGKIILEGEAVKLVPEMAKPEHFLNNLYTKVREQDLIMGACKACSAKLKVKDAIKDEGIPLIGEMMGHPATSDYIEQEYRILTF